MKGLFTGDWHLGINTHGVYDPNQGVNSNLIDIEEVADEIIESAISQNVDFFVHLGDLFHTNNPSSAENAVAIRIFNRLEKAGIFSIFITGNHDYILGKKLDPVDTLYEYVWDNIKCFSAPGIVELEEVRFYVIPHCSYKDVHSFVEDQNIVKDDKLSFILCHTAFDGCLVGSEDTMLSPGIHMVPKNLSIDAVFSGHIHKSQVLSHAYGAAIDVYYPGSPIAFDFGERNDSKEYIILSINGPSYEVEFVPVKKGRRLFQIETMDQSQWPDLAGSLVKVVLNERVDVEEVEQILYSKGVKKVVSVKIVDELEKENVIENNYSVQDDNELMWSYINSRLDGEEAKQAWQYAWESINAG